MYTAVLRRVGQAWIFALLLNVAALLTDVVAGGMQPPPRVVAARGVLAVAVAGWVLTARRRFTPLGAAGPGMGWVGVHLGYAVSMPGRRSRTGTECGHLSARIPAKVVVRCKPATATPAAGTGTAPATRVVLVLLSLRPIAGTVGRLIAALDAALDRAPSPGRAPTPHRLHRPAPTVIPTPRSALQALFTPRGGPPASLLSC